MTSFNHMHHWLQCKIFKKKGVNDHDEYHWEKAENWNRNRNSNHRSIQTNIKNLRNKHQIESHLASVA